MAQKHKANVSRLPQHMQAPARAYIEQGRSPGGFLKEVLEDNFCDAIGRADETNRAHLNDWALWLFNDIPATAWGSAERVDAWVEQGGLEGQ